MMRLEDLQVSAAVRGIFSDCLVTVVNVQWFGSEAEGIFGPYDGKSGMVSDPVRYIVGIPLEDRAEKFIQYRIMR